VTRGALRVDFIRVDVIPAGGSIGHQAGREPEVYIYPVVAHTLFRDDGMAFRTVEWQTEH
jgi:hypothetical protein